MAKFLDACDRETGTMTVTPVDDKFQFVFSVKEMTRRWRHEVFLLSKQDVSRLVWLLQSHKET